MRSRPDIHLPTDSYVNSAASTRKSSASSKAASRHPGSDKPLLKKIKSMILVNAKRESNVPTLVDVDSMQIPIDPFYLGYDHATSPDNEKRDEYHKKLPVSHAFSKDDIASTNSDATSLNPNDVHPTLTEVGDEKRNWPRKIR